MTIEEIERRLEEFDSGQWGDDDPGYVISVLKVRELLAVAKAAKNHPDSNSDLLHPYRCTFEKAMNKKCPKCELIKAILELEK